MVFPANSIHIPIEQDETGEIFVEGTRVPIDIIIGQFKHGATPRQIVDDYDVLNLGDVYAVIGYYLHNKADVEAYLIHQQHERDQAKQQAIERFQLTGIRERLLARQRERDKQ